MDLIVWVLFESLPVLAAGLGVILFALLVYWRRRRRPLPLLIGLGVAFALLIVQRAVVTPREHAIVTLNAIERDLEHARADALAAALAAEFDTEGMDRESFVRYVRGRIPRVDIRYLRRTALQLDPAEAGRFVAHVEYISDVGIEGMRGNLPSAWEITFARTPQGWRIVHIRCLRVGSERAPSFDDIERM
ncbi:MAG: hypothetical protein AB1716_15645 [Planctomycetota bacterium]